MSFSGKYFNEEENILVHENPRSRFVAAAGNDGVDLETNERYPANLAKHYSNIIAVGNLDERGIAARGSNYGPRHMIWMRGMNVRSTLPSDKYGYMSGTSQAAANATNALIRSYDRSTDSFSNLSNLEKGI
jgi:thermitase